MRETRQMRLERVHQGKQKSQSRHHDWVCPKRQPVF
jgi:hypothetical protein